MLGFELIVVSFTFFFTFFVGLEFYVSNGKYFFI
jgi:hypothetical protein